jgi:hypothetical protein
MIIRIGHVQLSGSARQTRRLIELGKLKRTILESCHSCPGGLMHTHDRQFSRKSSFEFAQLRECMHTVDSTEGPEVDNDNMPTKLANMQRMVAIDPVEAIRKIRRPHFASKLRCRHKLNLSVD